MSRTCYMFSDSIMALLRELGRGYLALCSYNCREAINILTSLPPQHYNTGWVLTHIGKGYFELAEYTQVTHTLFFFFLFRWRDREVVTNIPSKLHGLCAQKILLRTKKNLA